MEVEDDWDMTVEELDSLERDAFLLLNNSMCTNSNSTIFQNHLLPTLPTKPHFRFPSSKGGRFASRKKVIISAFRRIPRASWNAKERLWMFRFLPCKKQRRF